MKVYITVLVILLCAHCTERKEVTITKDYVLNPNWTEHENTIQVIRMDLKEEEKNIDLGNVTQRNLLAKLEEDPNFSYIGNVEYNGEDYADRRVYFNRYNGFVWWSDEYNLSKKILGELERNNWYRFGGLSKYRTLYYVYIDSIGNTHCFKVNISNF